ncbi:MAG: hypothetical protein ACI4J7_01830 [Ruminiclostridium sp.]
MGIAGLDHLADDIVEACTSGIGMDSITESAFAAAKECASECLENIRADCPSDSGEYKKGWVMRKTKQGYVVYNKTRPNLEMLLEHGHLITKGAKKGQRVQAHPHIYDNADKAREKFYDMCVDIVSSGVRLKFKRRK